MAILLFINGLLSEELAGTLMSLFYAFLTGIGMGKLHSQLEIKKIAGYPYIAIKTLLFTSPL